jgi:transcription elongation GreA/GreB family factor
MTFKQKTYHQFQQLLADKITNLHQQLDELKESTANETKSTAGDKYETARAMLQIEQDNIRHQLQEALEQQTRFSSVDRKETNQEVIQGCLVKTNRGWLLLSVALGKTIIEGIPVIALSPQSPLGKQLMGRKPGDKISINGFDYIIEEIQ